jgi:hypothetical protein
MYTCIGIIGIGYSSKYQKHGFALHTNPQRAPMMLHEEMLHL